MRQYDDPVEVRRGESEGPEQFLWRGRLWKVRAVVSHWVETGPWWQASTSSTDSVIDPVTDLVTGMVAERELWRVEAGRGAQSLGTQVVGEENVGIFDLSFDWTDGRWQLVGCQD